MAMSKAFVLCLGAMTMIGGAAGAQAPGRFFLTKACLQGEGRQHLFDGAIGLGIR